MYGSTVHHWASQRNSAYREEERETEKGKRSASVHVRPCLSTCLPPSLIVGSFSSTISRSSLLGSPEKCDFSTHLRAVVVDMFLHSSSRSQVNLLWNTVQDFSCMCDVTIHTSGALSSLPRTCDWTGFILRCANSLELAPVSLSDLYTDPLCSPHFMPDGVIAIYNV